MMSHDMENPGDIAPKDPTPAIWSKPAAPATPANTPDAPQGAAPVNTPDAPQGAGPAKTPEAAQTTDTPNTAAQDHERLKAQFRAVDKKPTVYDPILQKIVDPNYRENAKVGNGSTAAAIRHERSTGESVGGREHTQKGQDTIRALQKWLDKHPIDDPAVKTAAEFSQRKNDIAAAENMIADLTDALSTPLKVKGP